MKLKLLSLMLASVILVTLLCISVSAGFGDDFGYNSLGVPQLPINVTTGALTFNKSDIWVTDQGLMDNVPNLYGTLDLKYLELDGSNANQNIDIGNYNLTSDGIKTELITTESGNGNIHIKSDYLYIDNTINGDGSIFARYGNSYFGTLWMDGITGYDNGDNNEWFGIKFVKTTTGGTRASFMPRYSGPSYPTIPIDLGFRCYSTQAKGFSDCFNLTFRNLHLGGELYAGGFKINNTGTWTWNWDTNSYDPLYTWGSPMLFQREVNFSSGIFGGNNSELKILSNTNLTNYNITADWGYFNNLNVSRNINTTNLFVTNIYGGSPVNFLDNIEMPNNNITARFINAININITNITVTNINVTNIIVNDFVANKNIDISPFNFTTTGRIGIGTIIPTHTLNVVGDANVTGNILGTMLYIDHVIENTVGHTIVINDDVNLAGNDLTTTGDIYADEITPTGNLFGSSVKELRFGRIGGDTLANPYFPDMHVVTNLDFGGASKIFNLQFIEDVDEFKTHVIPDGIAGAYDLGSFLQRWGTAFIKNVEAGGEGGGDVWIRGSDDTPALIIGAGASGGVSERWRFIHDTSANDKLRIVDDAGTVELTIAQAGFIGINTPTPLYPLHVTGDTSDVSIWSQKNVSATGFITRTSIFDASRGNAKDWIKNYTDYIGEGGEINYSAFYGYVKYNHTDYSRPEIFYDEKEIIGVNNCFNETDYWECYPYELEEEGVSLGMEIDVLRQELFDMGTELCKLGVVKYC